MKTIQVTLFEFNELSEEAKETAIEQYRNAGYNHVEFAYNEAHQTIKAFNELFNVNEGRREWTDYSIDHWDDHIREMQGVRLYKYLWNNYGSSLYKGKYYGNLSSETAVKHKRIKSDKLSNGKYFNPYYSRIILVHEYVLTGMCYDDAMLSPIYKFLEHPEESTTFEELISDCFHKIKKTLENEEEYYNSDEYISEQLSENNYQFTINGIQY